MREGIRDTLVFDMKDLRHEDFKEFEALVSPASLDLAYEEVEFIEPLSCAVQLFRQVNDSVYVAADIEVKVSVLCRRCIGPFEVDVTTTLELLFAVGSESLERSEADERYYDGEILDISEDVRQGLILEMPVWPLCSEVCEGLCEHCGAALNHEVCSCETTDESAVLDSNPFSVLSRMLENN